MTAKEFLPETEIRDLMTTEKQKVWEAMVQFAKFHVDAALEAAAEKAKGKENPADYGTSSG